MHWGDNDDGGFMNTSVADEPTKLTEVVGISGEDKNKSIAAVSVCLIVKFTRPNEGLLLHNKKIYHLNLVAYVREILDINPTKIHVLVDDYTSGGPLEVTHIIGDTGTPGEDNDYALFNDNNQNDTDENATKNLQSISVGDYVRCIGVVKFSQDKPNLVAYNMRIVEDPNEVTTHTLEVIRDYMFYERQAKGGVPHAMNGSIQQPTNGAAMNNNGGMGGGGGGGGELNNYGNLLSTRDKHLLKFLKDRKATNLSVDDIANNFKAFTRKEIEDSLNHLSTEGLVWPGDDDQLWCVGE